MLSRYVSEIRRRCTFLALRGLFRPAGGNSLERLGSSYGGWLIPVELVHRDSVVYSVGVGEDVTFDVELIRRVGCVVHAFDPTPRAQAFMARAQVPSELLFHAYGIWTADGSVRFYAPRDPAHVSHSIANIQRTETFFEGAVKTLASAMQDLGHREIDVLKMDIEGAEYEVLRHMATCRIWPKVLCVELESPSLVRNVDAVARLRRVGYRVVGIDRRNITLVRSCTEGTRV